MGRRPQPAALKLLRGRTVLNTREPRPPAGTVERPAWLSPAAARIWDTTAPICLAMGTLTAADVHAFGAFCELQSTLEALVAGKVAALEGTGILAIIRDDDEIDRYVVTIDQVVKHERDAAAALRPYFNLFGLDPASRSRLVVGTAPAAAPASKWGQ